MNEVLVTRLHHRRTLSFILALYVVVHNILTYLVFSQGNLELSQQEPDAIVSVLLLSIFIHIWKQFMRWMKENQNTYLKQNVVATTPIFQSFRNFKTKNSLECESCRKFLPDWIHNHMWVLQVFDNSQFISTHSKLSSQNRHYRWNKIIQRLNKS